MDKEGVGEWGRNEGEGGGNVSLKFGLGRNTLTIIRFIYIHSQPNILRSRNNFLCIYLSIPCLSNTNKKVPQSSVR